jgi:hypothetical protein
MNEQELEKEIKAKGLTAVRLTPEIIDSKIKEITYFYKGTLTICVITVQNGNHVIGESACVSPKNYDKEIGDKLAFDDARRKIWRLEGYRLAEEQFYKDM